MASMWTGARAKESAAAEAIPILSQPITYINTSELLVRVVTSCNSMTVLLQNESDISKI